MSSLNLDTITGSDLIELFISRHVISISRQLTSFRAMLLISIRRHADVYLSSFSCRFDADYLRRFMLPLDIDVTPLSNINTTYV